MNKIALTGHTSGLGLAIHNHFSIECVFSRSNNYDLLDAKNIKSMVNAAQDCDIFINNAFPAIAADKVEGMSTQLDILYQMYQRWEKHNNKLIINLGSNTSDGIKKHVWPYAAAKAATDKACEQLSYLKDGPKVCNLRFGYIDFPHINKIAPNEKKISVATALNSIQYVIDTFNAGNTVRELTVIP
jgi:NAD(P)-dependent dehydrogenase (short-subunit alcohol dehydrogenase family)